MFKKIVDNVAVVSDKFVDLYGTESEYQKGRYNKLIDKFYKNFNSYGYMASSSGRVEICGNHTDHNGGKALACAISLDTLGVFLPTNDNVITVLSDGYPKCVYKIGDRGALKGTTLSLIEGICSIFEEKGYKTGGFNAVLTSDVPNGGGISSSASFELLIAEILDFLYNDGSVSAKEKAIISKRAENEFFGKPCGMLDQSAVAFGGLVELDFKDEGDVKVEKLNDCFENYSLILIDTGSSHDNLTDEYAAIPKEMAEICRFFNKKRLIEVDKAEFMEKLPLLKEKASGRAILRALHFYEENERVNSCVSAIKEGEIFKVLQNIKLSGLSSLLYLQNCYFSKDISEPIPLCLKLIDLIDKNIAARVHGGGFAGTVLCVIKDEDSEKFIEKLSLYYKKENINKLKVRNFGSIVL